MDTDQKLINAVRALLAVVDEGGVDLERLSEPTRESFERAKREMQGAQSKSDEDALL